MFRRTFMALAGFVLGMGRDSPPGFAGSSSPGEAAAQRGEQDAIFRQFTTVSAGASDVLLLDLTNNSGGLRLIDQVTVNQQDSNFPAPWYAEAFVEEAPGDDNWAASMNVYNGIVVTNPGARWPDGQDFQLAAWNPDSEAVTLTANVTYRQV